MVKELPETKQASETSKPEENQISPVSTSATLRHVSKERSNASSPDSWLDDATLLPAPGGGDTQPPTPPDSQNQSPEPDSTDWMDCVDWSQCDQTPSSPKPARSPSPHKNWLSIDDGLSLLWAVEGSFSSRRWWDYDFDLTNQRHPYYPFTSSSSWSCYVRLKGVKSSIRAFDSLQRHNNRVLRRFYSGRFYFKKFYFGVYSDEFFSGLDNDGILSMN